MKSGFWKNMPRPIIGLSPMDGVTDHPFRHITKKYGKPDVIYTEFAPVEGFCRGVERPLLDFLYDETQRPIVGQIYGTTPQFFRETAVALCQMGFDGIDINMGCPAKSVAHSGAGAGLIQTPKLAQEIITATKAGVEDWQNGMTVQGCPSFTDPIRKAIEERFQKLPLSYQSREREIPVSVKTRIGYSTPVVEDWIPVLLEMEPAAIALHGRTLRQGYSGLASWDHIAKAAQLVHEAQTGTLILGNGDVHDLSQAHQVIQDYGVDGVLIGRASFGNPWVFQGKPAEEFTLKERISLALEHSHLYETVYRVDDRYRFLPMRKNLAWYIKGFPNASDFRSQLMQTESAAEVESIMKNIQIPG